MTAPERSERELQELLPFYVNGTLDGDDLAAVEAYLARSEKAREEVVYLERLRNAMQSQPQVNSPGELGLKRLQREMSRAGEQGTRAADMAATAQHSARASVPAWWRNLAVAACLVVAVLGVLTVTDWTGDRDGLRLAGGESAAVLQVTFKPQATEDSIRALLLEIGASITEGPSALGVYRLSLEPGADDAVLSNALRQLRTRGNVVESAERE